MRGTGGSQDPRAVKSFESKESGKQKQSQGRDLIIKDLFFSSVQK